MKIGQIYESNNYGAMRIVRYDNAKSVLVEFLDTGYQTLAAAQSIRAGLVTDHQFKKTITNAKKLEKREKSNIVVIDGNYISIPDDMVRGTVYRSSSGYEVNVVEFKGSQEVIVKDSKGFYCVFSSAVLRARKFKNIPNEERKRRKKAVKLSTEITERLNYLPDTGEFVRRDHKGVVAGSKIGSKTTNGKLEAVVGGVRCGVDHLVYLMEVGDLPLGVLVHVNGDNCDNRFSNLQHKLPSCRVLSNYSERVVEQISSVTADIPAPGPASNGNSFSERAAKIKADAERFGKLLGVPYPVNKP